MSEGEKKKLSTQNVGHFDEINFPGVHVTISD